MNKLFALAAILIAIAAIGAWQGSDVHAAPPAATSDHVVSGSTSADGTNVLRFWASGRIDICYWRESQLKCRTAQP